MFREPVLEPLFDVLTILYLPHGASPIAQRKVAFKKTQLPKYNEIPQID